MRFRLRCEMQTDAGETCPVRFEWIGPWRDDPNSEHEARDEAAAIDRATEIGWWFGTSLVACPRHAAPIETAPDLEEHPAHA